MCIKIKKNTTQEQEKNGSFDGMIREKEQSIRAYLEENDLLLFNNERLEKRVRILMQDIEQMVWAFNVCTCVHGGRSLIISPCSFEDWLRLMACMRVHLLMSVCVICVSSLCCASALLELFYVCSVFLQVFLLLIEYMSLMHIPLLSFMLMPFVRTEYVNISLLVCVRAHHITLYRKTAKQTTGGLATANKTSSRRKRPACCVRSS